MFFKRRKKAVEEPDIKALSAEDEAERMKEDVRWFKRIMSHNIRMPLAVIVGYLCFLRICSANISSPLIRK